MWGLLDLKYLLEVHLKKSLKHKKKLCNQVGRTVYDVAK